VLLRSRGGGADTTTAFPSSCASPSFLREVVRSATSEAGTSQRASSTRLWPEEMNRQLVRPAFAPTPFSRDRAREERALASRQAGSQSHVTGQHLVDSAAWVSRSSTTTSPPRRAPPNERFAFRNGLRFPASASRGSGLATRDLITGIAGELRQPFEDQVSIPSGRHNPFVPRTDFRDHLTRVAPPTRTCQGGRVKAILAAPAPTRGASSASTSRARSIPSAST